ncbi:MAG: DNA-processing protein DprA [Gammaproteobacteria bacterium]
MKCSQQDWLKLVRFPGLGAGRLSPLIKESHNLSDLLQKSSGKLSEKLHLALNSESPEIDQDMKWLEQDDHNLVVIGDKHYPGLLYQIDDPPIALFCQGQTELLELPQLAIVGSRNPSRQGVENARAFARFLAESGLVITSGMALGIDTSAHQGALAASGKTIAVIGTGPDRVYPASNYRLAHEITEKGLIISEFAPGTEAKPGHFPRRNRLISALSLGTLVVEATLKSGSLITARLALEQGREVFAIPGSIHSPQSKGCHRLIKQGAKLVENAQDIIDELSAMFSSLSITDQPSKEVDSLISSSALDQDYQQLLDIIGWEPILVEQIVESSPFSAEEVSSMLLLLELQGHVSSAPGGFYCRTGSA